MHALPPVSEQVVASRYCYLDAEVTREGPLRVACAGREQCERNYLVERNGFPCHGLEWVAEGVGEVVLDGQSFMLTPGVVFAYGPATRHRIANTGDGRMTKYFVDFYGAEAEQWLERGHLRAGQAGQVFDGGPLRELFEQLIHVGQADGTVTRELAAAYLRVILLRLGLGTVPVARPSAAADSLYHRCMDLIERDFARLKNLQELSDELHTQPSRLCRIFKNQGQPGPFGLLTRRKLHRAAELLAAGRVSVQEAAAQVGYDDPYHFSRLFRKHFGKPPVAFRAEFRRGG